MQTFSMKKMNYSFDVEAPNIWFAKLSTDHSVLGNPSKASASGLLRDSDGLLIKGFYHNIRVF